MYVHDIKGGVKMTKQAVSIKVGCKTYNVSNSWNSLFICGNDEERRSAVLSVFEQLADEKYKDKAEVRLLSGEPDKYRDNIAQHFDAKTVDLYLEEMLARYMAIADCEVRNYIQYNQREGNDKMKLLVLIIDGADGITTDPCHVKFKEKLTSLVQKSRAAGIHVITFINEMPPNDEDFFKYYGTPVHVMRRGFFAKDATNTIISTLFSLGYSPIINLSYDKEEETVWIGINLEIDGVHLSFSFNYDAHTVEYALLFPIAEPLDRGTVMELCRVLRTDDGFYFNSFSDNLYEEHVAVTGNRRCSVITPTFVQRLAEQVYTLKIVKILKKIQKP